MFTFLSQEETVEDKPPRLTHDHDIGDGDKVWVFDNVLTYRDIPLIRELLSLPYDSRKFIHEVQYQLAMM